MVNLTVTPVPVDTGVECASQAGAELEGGDTDFFAAVLGAASEFPETAEEPETTQSSAPVDTGTDALVTVAVAGHAVQVASTQPALPDVPGSAGNAQANGQAPQAEAAILAAAVSETGAELSAVGRSDAAEAAVVPNGTRSASPAEAESGTQLQRTLRGRPASRDLAAQTRLVQAETGRGGTRAPVEPVPPVQQADEATPAEATDTPESVGPSQGRGSRRASGESRPNVALTEQTHEPVGIRWRQATVTRFDRQQQASRGGPSPGSEQRGADASIAVSQASRSAGERSSEGSVLRLDVDSRLTGDLLLSGSEKASQVQSDPRGDLPRGRLLPSWARSEANVAVAVSRAAPEALRVEQQTNSVVQAVRFDGAEPDAAEIAVPHRVTGDLLLLGSEKASQVQSDPGGDSLRDHLPLGRARSEANVAVAVPRAAPEALRVEQQTDSVVQAMRSQGAEPDAVEVAVSRTALETRSGGGDASGNTPAGGASVPASGSQFSAAMGEATQAAEFPTNDSADQHARIIDQVVREVRLHRFDDRSDLVVRLNPPELGVLRVRITQDAAGVSSHIQASSDHIRGLLQAHMPALVDALSDAGLKMDSVSVSSGSSFSALAHDAAHGNAHSGAEQARQRSTFAQGTVGLQTAEVANQLPRHVDQGAYNWLA